MFRYVAFVWDHASPMQSQAAQILATRLQTGGSSKWEEVAHCAGLRVFCTGIRTGASEVYPLANHTGVVLGTLFQRNAEPADSVACPKAVLGEAESEAIIRSAGRRLITHYWGRYVAFLSDPRTNKRRVLRDPIGHLPCYEARFRGVAIFFSFMSDCLRLNLPRLTINWHYVRARVAIGPYHTPETALNEVWEVHPGECVEFHHANVLRALYWDPREIARSDPITAAPGALISLRATAKACVHAWASCHERVILRLSGGLDSGIVLGCLQDAPARPRIISTVHYTPQAPHSDPRTYARTAAERAGCELIERDRTEATMNFEDLMRMAPAPKPPPHLADLERAPWEWQLARERGASAIIGGDGGDALFCRLNAPFYLTDYVHDHGLQPQLASLATTLAMRAQVPAWRLLARALTNSVVRRALAPEDGIVTPRELVNASVRRAVLHERPYIHPWFESAPDVPPGKQLHIRLLHYTEEPYYIPLAPPDAPEPLAPLYSQPLVELCLRVTTYVHQLNGKDRELARQAFATDVPREILGRYWKGRPGDVLETQFRRSLKFFRTLLMDGELVQRGFLDRNRLSQCLSGQPSPIGNYMEVFDHALSEACVQVLTREIQHRAPTQGSAAHC